MKFKRLLVEAMMYLMTDIDEEELMGELDALEADVGMETEGDGVPACVHPDLEEELILPPASTEHAAPAVPAGRVNQDTMIEPCRSSTTTTSLANLAMQNSLTERTVSKERNTR